MYGNRQTFPSPSAKPTIVMMAPNRVANVSRFWSAIAVTAAGGGSLMR